MVPCGTMRYRSIKRGGVLAGKPGRRAGHGDIVSILRGGLKRGLILSETRGRSLADMWADALEKDFLGAMGAAAKILPKEHNVEVTPSDEYTRVLKGLRDASSQVIGESDGTAGGVNPSVAEESESVRH